MDRGPQDLFTVTLVLRKEFHGMTADLQRSPKGLILDVSTALARDGFDMVEGDLHQLADDGSGNRGPVTIALIGTGPTPPTAVARVAELAKFSGYLVVEEMTRRTPGPGRFVTVTFVLTEDPMWPSQSLIDLQPRLDI